MELNWEAIGAVSELLGSLAVFATLIYLATQVRQTNNIALYSSQKELLGAYNEINILIATDSSIRETLLKKEELSEHEEKQIYAFAMLLGATWTSAESGFKNGQVWEQTYLVLAKDVTMQMEQWPTLRRPLNLWLENHPDIAKNFDIVQPILAEGFPENRPD